MQSVRGRNVLIVEDEYLLAADLSRYFRSMGATILGPAPSVAAARAEVDRADAAVLDIDLAGDKVFPIADALAARGVPFVFFTAYSDIAIPERFNQAGHLTKPVRSEAVFNALFPDTADAGDNPAEDVVAILPKLRLSARLLVGDARAADRLVEVTLERAIDAVAARPPGDGVETWLSGLLEDTWRRYGAALLN